ncbi:MAG TPA: 4'-phosphopantetheinyl transferase superfamily protein [Acidobacteriaceae bacterium]|jgi:4'-phosphopantetheinyl transferase|nr:4'-phosphopantetheinyl transferase superfamily protein [Acidobacteriaceae bacterium]
MQELELRDGPVHVWSFGVDAPAPVVAHFAELLTGEERDRAGRFAYASLRDRFVVVRGALRSVLSGFLDCAPGAIELAYGPAGKPRVASGDLEFNLSHSGQRAAIALTRGSPVGIDMEQIRRVEDRPRIVERYFCRAEAEEIRALPEGQQERAFFCCWTRKEAYIKAIGEGLGVSLDAFRVTVAPDGPARLIEVGGRTEDAEEWVLEDISPEAGYAGALAYRGGKRTVQVTRVNPGELLQGPGR